MSCFHESIKHSINTLLLLEIQIIKNVFVTTSAAFLSIISSIDLNVFVFFVFLPDSRVNNTAFMITITTTQAWFK